MRKFLLFPLIFGFENLDAQTIPCRTSTPDSTVAKSIRWRCNAQITDQKNTTLLYVLDGKLINDVGAINADSIESIEVLNAAPAMALFGCSAFNGAILVTSKNFAVARRKVLKEVIVTSGITCRIRCTLRCGGSHVKVVKTPIEKHKPPVASLFKIYPNPVARNAFFNIEMSNIQNGKYSFQIINNQGGIVQQEDVVVDGNNFISRMALKQTTAAGNYFFRIADADGKLINAAKLVVL